MDETVTFGAWLKQRRRLLDLTQKELARLTSCSVGTIRKIEAGERRPSRQLAELLAEQLQIPAETHDQFIQMGRGRYVPGMSSPLDETNQPPHNLPPQMTPFVGREAELARLQQLLAEPDVHLITILGPGGIGKTRLALALAARYLNGQPQTYPFAHGVYFASLARLETADLLLPAIAETLNFRFVEGDEPQKQLLRYLANKAMLLVLDNFEHLLAGAGLVDEILRAAPRVKIIITSRVRVNRRVEQMFPLDGMALSQENGTLSGDGPLDLGRNSAVQLFVQCAQRVRPDFGLTPTNQAHVLNICRLLQGMPLGIVLAAGWLESLSPRAINNEMQQDIDFLATEMEDVPARQRSLRAAFKHSWRLLSTPEQKIFCQMSIFRGGFTRAAALAVTGASLRDLQALVNKSLLTLGPDRRYQVHELLRQFAMEKLSEAEELETAASDRHSTYYCNLLQQHTASWHNAQQLEALAEVTREADNVGRAWRWALQQAAWPRLVGAIDSWGWYHRWQGLRADGEAYCGAICAAVERWIGTMPADAAAGYRLWAKAMAWFGEFAMAIKVAAERFEQGLALLAGPELADGDTRQVEAFILLQLGYHLNAFDRQKARACMEESLLLYEALQDSGGISKALLTLGRLDWSVGDYASARQSVQTSLHIQQERGDQWGQIESLDLQGWIHLHLGRLPEAERFRRDVLDLCRKLGDRYHLAAGTAALSFTVATLGRYDEGQAWGKKSLNLCLEDGNLTNEGFARLAVGWSQLFAGKYRRAQQELTRSLAAVREVNNYGVEASVHCTLGYLALVEMAYDKAQAAFEEGYRLYQAVQGDTYILLALSGLGLSTCCRGDLDRSRHHFIDLLTDGLRRKDLLFLLYALPGIALYLTRRGEVEQAVVVWAQAQCWPCVANSQLYEDMVGQVVARVTADLPLDVVAAARENGSSQEIWDMAEQLLADLSRHS